MGKNFGDRRTFALLQKKKQTFWGTGQKDSVAKIEREKRGS